MIVSGNKLKVGDVISVWWKPRHDKITKLIEYKGCWKNLWKNGVRIASFEMYKGEMTIGGNNAYEKIN